LTEWRPVERSQTVKEGLKAEPRVIADRDGSVRKAVNMKIEGDLDKVVGGEERERPLVMRFKESGIADDAVVNAGVRVGSMVSG